MSAPRRPRWYSPLAPVRKPPLPPRPPKRWLRTNPRFCAVCLAEPDALQHYPFAASTVSAWDRTEPAMRAVCRALANPQI